MAFTIGALILKQQKNPVEFLEYLQYLKQDLEVWNPWPESETALKSRGFKMRNEHLGNDVAEVWYWESPSKEAPPA